MVLSMLIFFTFKIIYLIQKWKLKVMGDLWHTTPWLAEGWLNLLLIFYSLLSLPQPRYHFLLLLLHLLLQQQLHRAGQPTTSWVCASTVACSSRILLLCCRRGRSRGAWRSLRWGPWCGPGTPRCRAPPAGSRLAGSPPYRRRSAGWNWAIGPSQSNKCRLVHSIWGVQNRPPRPGILEF